MKEFAQGPQVLDTSIQAHIERLEQKLAALKPAIAVFEYVSNNWERPRCKQQARIPVAQIKCITEEGTHDCEGLHVICHEGREFSYCSEITFET